MEESEPPSRQIIRIVPRPDDLLNEVHRLAALDRVAFTDHAYERMEERDITDLQALRVLQRGSLTGPIEQGNKPGEWKCKITDTVRGAREVGVVTIVVFLRRLIVKTVEWEDL